MASQVKHELGRNLILPDQYLTNETIDELWDWFCDATTEQVNLQWVFVKLLNCAREPYLKHLFVEQPSSSNDRFGSKRNTCYTPSECTVLDQCSEMPSPRCARINIFEHDLQTELVDAATKLTVKSNAIWELERQLNQERKMNEEKYTELEAKYNELREFAPRTNAPNIRTTELARSQPARVKPVRVALESVAFPGQYLSLYASEVRSYNEAGGGNTCVRISIGAWETFELIESPDVKGIVYFKLEAFENIFLRADAKVALGKSVNNPVNGGTVNAQYGCGKLEQFRIISLKKRKVVIESVASPGRFVRMDGDEGVVNMQSPNGRYGEFYLVIVL